MFPRPLRLSFCAQCHVDGQKGPALPTPEARRHRWESLGIRQDLAHRRIAQGSRSDPSTSLLGLGRFVFWPVSGLDEPAQVSPCMERPARPLEGRSAAAMASGPPWDRARYRSCNGSGARLKEGRGKSEQFPPMGASTRRDWEER